MLTQQNVVEWAARVLLEDDPEWFVGGCADIAAAIEEFAKRLGLSDVHAVYGSMYLRGEGWLPHAWLRVEGVVYDPRADLEGKTFLRLREDVTQGACDVFGVDEDTTAWKADTLVEMWNATSEAEKRVVLTDEWLRDLRWDLEERYNR
jgi:hypothetical protein